MAGDGDSVFPVAGGFYSYDPSKGGNAVFLAAFALLALVVPYLGIRSWTPFFSVTLTIGFLAEALGFLGRVLLYSERDNQTYYFLFLLGTVLGPTFISTSILVVLPHILGIYGDHISPLRPLMVGLVFCGLATVFVVVELVGITLVAYQSIDLKRNIGACITSVGLGIQAATLLARSGLHFWFTVRLSSRRESLDARHHHVYTSSSFKRLVMAMELASLLLIVYSTYRVVEFADGLSSSLFQSQPAFMVIGGVVPLIAGIILTVFHPGPIFGNAWAETTPHGLTNIGRPSPIPHPSGQLTHLRYNPDIRKQHLSMSQRPLQGSMGPPTSFPGLPASPRPSATPMTSISPQNPLNLPRVRASELVDQDGLW